MAWQCFVWLFIKEELFDGLVLKDVLQDVADLVIDLLASNFNELEACLNKLSMALEEDALAPFVVSNSVCYSPYNRLEEFNSA